MPFQTSMQGLFGANSGVGSAVVFVDWARNRVWTQPNTGYVTRIGLLTGVQEAFAPNSDYPGINNNGPIGIDSTGNVYFVGPSGLRNGGITQVNGSTLALMAQGSYPSNDGGNGGFCCIPYLSTEYIADLGPGGGLAALTNVTLSINTSETFFAPWPAAQPKAVLCPASSGSNFAYLIQGPTDLSTTQEIVLGSVTVLPASVGIIGSSLATDIDPAWTSISLYGACLDQTDGNPMIAVSQQGSRGGYIVKLDKSDGSVLWTSALPNSQLGIVPGWNLSSVVDQKLYVAMPSFFGSPPCTIVTIDTSDGSSTSYNTGLANMVIYGQQISNDTLGCIVLSCNYASGPGAPLPLNGTPNFNIRWGALYVAEGITPPPVQNRKWMAQLGPIRVLN